MTAVTIPGAGLVHSQADRLQAAPVFDTNALIDATGEKVAFVGRVWWPDRGTHAVRTVGWRAGAITSAGGSGITISLQDPDATTGAPSRPDGTQDQTVGVLLSALTANAWNENTFSADRAAVAHGSLLCVVWEFDGSGRLGADLLRVALIGASGTSQTQGAIATLFTAAWGATGGVPNLVLKADDGTVGTLGRCWGISAINTHAPDTGSSPDEIANQIKFNAPVTLEGVEVLISVGAGGDFSVILYEGTTAIETVTVDEDTTPTMAAAAPRWSTLFFATPRALTKDTVYRVAIRPDTASAGAIAFYSLDVNAAAYLGLLAGADFHYWDRVDAGAWANETTTRWVLMRLLLSQVSDGGGGGGAFPFIG